MSAISPTDGVTHPPIATSNAKYRFDMEEFLLCENDLEYFERWYANRPNFKLSDGDWRGYTLLMHAVGAGNVLLVKRLVEIAEQKKENLNTMSSRGWSVFEAAEELADDGSETSRVVECVKILIDTGADINIRDKESNTPLDNLIDKAESLCRKTNMRRIMSLIKLYVDAGAKCHDEKKKIRTQSKFLLEAQQEHLDLEKMKLLYFAKMDPNSTMQGLPAELFSKIAHSFWDQNY